MTVDHGFRIAESTAVGYIAACVSYRYFFKPIGIKSAIADNRNVFGQIDLRHYAIVESTVSDFGHRLRYNESRFCDRATDYLCYGLVAQNAVNRGKCGIFGIHGNFFQMITIVGKVFIN